MEMQRHRFTRYLAVLTLPLLLTLPASASAQAFGINEIGTCAASRGFAVTGSPCQDASSVFWNPGMQAPQRGWNILAGAAAIIIGGSFTEDTTFERFEGDVPTAIVPHAFVSYRGESSRLSYGLGVYAPYGLTSQWTDSFPGRFLAKKAALATLYFQPNVAYAINDKWSVGAGPVIGYSRVELIQALDLSEQTAAAGLTFANLGIARRTEFGRATLEGSATGFGGHLGVLGKPNDEWTVGLRFLTRIDFEYDGGDATFSQTQTGLILPPGNPICSQPVATRPAFCADANDIVNVDTELLGPEFSGGRLVTQGVETKISHPAQIQAGFGYTGFQNWLLSVDYAWTGWRAFKELPVTFLGAASGSSRVLIEDYNNSSAIRVGAQRAFSNRAQLRLGFSGVASAAPDETVTPLLPEQDRTYLSIGGEYPLTSRFSVEGAYLSVLAGGKRGRIQERTSPSQVASQLNTGVYELDAHVFSISFKANY
jgi:long-chain fatty acid transport protein